MGDAAFLRIDGDFMLLSFLASLPLGLRDARVTCLRGLVCALLFVNIDPSLQLIIWFASWLIEELASKYGPLDFCLLERSPCCSEALQTYFLLELV